MHDPSSPAPTSLNPSTPHPSGPHPDSADPEEIRAVLVDGEIHIQVPYPSPLVAQVRTLPGRRWDRALRVWRMPDSADGREAVRTVLGVEVQRAPHTVRPPPFQRVGDPRASRKVDPRVERFDEEMRLRGYALRTRKAYLGHARRFLHDVGEGTDLATDLREHVLRKLRGGRMSRSYHSQLISALRLFCATVLGRQIENLPLVRPRREHRLPTVLSHEELLRFLGAIRNPKHVAILTVAYSAGLRVSEVVRLRLEDLDRSRGLLQVRGGKGRKDRCTLLSETALTLVDAYLEGWNPGR